MIIIEKETEESFDFDYTEIIEKVIYECIDFESCPYESEISVTLTDNENIHRINKEFREIDRPTDVLSFPMVEYDKPGKFDFLEESDSAFNPETGELILGDIVISIPKVKEQAEEYGHSQIRELAFLTVHSMLHLFGYDHILDEDRVIMEEKQRRIMDNLGINR